MMNESEIGYLMQVDNETNKGYQYSVSQDYLIGRSVQCNLKIVENCILDQHCRIKLVGNKVCVFSLNPQNPIFLNNELVSEEGKPLKDQDKIRINDDYQFEWRSASHRKICCRSFPLENEPSLIEVNARYSDSALSVWKNVDRHPEESTEDTNVAPQSSVSEQKDGFVKVDEPPELLKMEFIEKSNVSISCEINRSFEESENNIKCSENTPVKSRKSKNPVSPFRVSNTFMPDSRNDKSSHQDDNDEMNLKCSTKNIPEDEFENLVIHHSTSQKPFHSTPKAVSTSNIRKSTRFSSLLLIDSKLETTIENNSSKLQTCGDESEEIDKLNVKSTCKDFNHDETRRPTSTSKKNISTPMKRACESLNESRRNTRGRTSFLRKTFEENSCGNEVKSFTTPEKLTEANVTQALFAGDSEMKNVTGTITDYKCLNESSKAGFASVSDENDTCETSFIDKYKVCNIVKNVSVSKPAVAKCARNLSYISPPENNRSQEYMDSMVSTPQKNSSPQPESIPNSATLILSNSKDSSFESMNASHSSARKRRSTGFTPFVGTPSNEYRVTRKMSTPFSRLTLGQTSVDFDTGSSRDGKHSFERSSTPFKALPGKSSIRDSFSCHPTIQESVSFEELETNNYEHDSINDSKFRNITKRRGRRRFGESIFAGEDKILEESELKSDASELDGDCLFDEENTEESITQTSTFLEECDELSTKDKTKTKAIKNPFELKSILTPLPKSMASKEKSAKRVTFAFPSSPESTIDKENTTESADECFAMINTWKQQDSSNRVIYDEELHVSDQQETDPSFNSVSEPEDDVSVTYSVEEKCDESSLNVTGVEYLANIQSNLNDLSGVEQIESLEPSPMKCTSTEIDNEVIEIDEKINAPNKVPERSPVNFTEMENSLAFSEASNRSHIATETHKKVGSFKDVAQIVNDKDLNSSSTKISCSPGIHLSGVKSLFNTPEKSRSSSIDKGIKCNLNFNNLSGLKTKGETRTKLKSASASKSIEAMKQNVSAKSSRLCKSLILDEMTSLKRETEPVDEILIEQSYVTVETSENETVTHDLLYDGITSVKPITKPVSTNERKPASHEIPEIIITEATFVAENANDEQMELTENREKKVIKSSKIQLPCKVELEDNNVAFETFDFENKLNSHLDEILSSQNDTTEMNKDTSSLVISEICRSAALKAPSDLIIISSDDKIQPEVNESLATVNFSEKKPEKEIESNTLCSIVSAVSDEVLPLSECTEKSAKELQSSSKLLILDQDNLQVSDMLFSEYTGDTDSSKTAIDESSYNNSQLTESSVKNASDLDSLKLNINESSCSTSQLSDSSTKYSNDSDTWKNNPVDDIFDHQLNNLLFDDEDVNAELSENIVEEPVHVELSENNVKTKIIECLLPGNVTQDDIGKDLLKSDDMASYDPTINVSQSTSSSQEMEIRIDASSALINDLHKVLEVTPHPSKHCSVEATPIETFKPISFPDSTNISSIGCTSSTKPDISTKPNLPSVNISDEVFTPIKTYVRGSSTPQSTVRRCRKSSRIHRCNTNDSINKPCMSVHDCSIVLDNSPTKSNVESAQEPSEVYRQVVAELNAKLVGVKKKIEEVQKLPIKEKSFENINKSILFSESAPSIDPISSLLPSGQSSDDENIVITNSTDMFTTNNDPFEHQSVDETIEDTCPEQEESSSITEINAGTSEILNIAKSFEQSKNLLITLVANKEPDLEQTASIPGKRKCLRTRKERSTASVVDIPKQVVTRNRRKAQPLWYKNNFHCYLCSNYPETFNKCIRKTKMKQLKEELSEAYDDKENVCSLLKVADTSKKMKLPEKEIPATARSVIEKRGRKPRSLKNVENISAKPDFKQDVQDFRSCSIVLPVLNPEIINSQLKVDESGNISLVEEPPVAPKRRRAVRTANTAEPKPALATSQTRKRSVETVTFSIAQNKCDEIEKPVDKDVRSKATASKRNLRNQPSTVGPQIMTRSRKTVAKDEIKRDEKLVARTVEMKLKPTNVDKLLTEPVEKKTRSKRGTFVAKVNEKTTVKVRTQKRASELDEEDVLELPKRRRIRDKTADEVSTKEVTKSKNNEIITELPKRTRGQAKINVRVGAPSTVNTVVKSTKTAKSKPVSNDSSVSKKLIKGVEESLTKNDAEKSNKKTKFLKNVEIIAPNEPIESVPAKKVNPANKRGASTFKTITPRMTRSKKTEVIKHADIVKVKNPPKETRTRKKPITAVKSSLNMNLNNSTNSKHAVIMKSPVKEKVATKRAVVTRSKNISIKKGRISTTLKTSIARKSLGKSSPIKALSENNLPPTANQRSTRRRAK